jgi:hypothetical protein
MGQRGLGVLVDQFTRRHQVTGDGVGGRAIQRRQFTPDLRIQLPCLDIGRDSQALVLLGPLVILSVVLRLGAPGAGPAPRLTGTGRRPRALAATAMSVLDHSDLPST